MKNLWSADEALVDCFVCYGDRTSFEFDFIILLFAFPFQLGNGDDDLSGAGSVKSENL